MLVISPVPSATPPRETAVLALITGVNHRSAAYGYRGGSSLRAMLLTHSHWDHVSGLPDFPGVPVWIASQERDFIRKSGSLDFCKLFSVVPSPGHTPGSVIIFVTLHNGTRYAFVGDLVWQMEGITQREERPWIVRRTADLNVEGTRKHLLHMIALKQRLPELIIVPAHDLRAFS